MPRLLLSNEHWSKLREILRHKTIYNKRDLRMTVEGMLYRMHGMPLAGFYPRHSETGTRSTSASMYGPLQANGSRSSRRLWLNPTWNGFSLMAATPRLTSTVQAPRWRYRKVQKPTRHTAPLRFSALVISSRTTLRMRPACSLVRSAIVSNGGGEFRFAHKCLVHVYCCFSAAQTARQPARHPKQGRASALENGTVTDSSPVTPGELSAELPDWFDSFAVHQASSAGSCRFRASFSCTAVPVSA